MCIGMELSGCSYLDTLVGSRPQVLMRKDKEKNVSQTHGVCLEWKSVYRYRTLWTFLPGGPGVNRGKKVYVCMM